MIENIGNVEKKGPIGPFSCFVLRCREPICLYQHRSQRCQAPTESLVVMNRSRNHCALTKKLDSGEESVISLDSH